MVFYVTIKRDLGWNNDPNVHGAICRCFLPGNRDIRESIDMLLNEKVFNGKIIY